MLREDTTPEPPPPAERPGLTEPWPYAVSPALVTDLYQLTMVYGYWKRRMHERRAAFAHFFRRAPFMGGFAVACGLGTAVAYLERLRFDAQDLAYLATLTDSTGQPLFSPEFLEFLEGFRFACDVHAVPEGTVVFPREPMVRVEGPLYQCQLIETALLCLVNFQTLIATKAARVCLAAEGDPVFEFGLRRAQGMDGGLSAARAAYVGGCAGTSNVLAGRLFGIPCKGTHAHSWVMCFPSEREAFQAYAEAMPGNCILLVDTYGTEQGIENAIETAHWLADHGHRLNGVRLDSGDLDALSRMARERLDNAGLQDVAIVGSNDLDEHAVAELKRKGAPIRVWGVGTRLATGYADAALGGVYKLTAIQDEHGQWLGKLKLSDEATKSSLPGHALQVRRVLDRNGLFAGDIVYQEPGAPLPGSTVHDLISGKPLFTLTADAVATDLLGPVFIDGRCVYDPLALAAVRDRCQEQLRLVPEQVRRLQEPAVYPVGMEQGLESVRRTLRDQFSSSGGHPGE